MKQLLTALLITLAASAVSAKTQEISDYWMDKLDLWDVVWIDDAPNYQHWLLNNYETAEEAGDWRIKKLKATYAFNNYTYPGTDEIFGTAEEQEPEEYNTLEFYGVYSAGGGKPRLIFKSPVYPDDTLVVDFYFHSPDDEWKFKYGSNQNTWDYAGIDQSTWGEYLVTVMNDEELEDLEAVKEYFNKFDEITLGD